MNKLLGMLTTGLVALGVLTAASPALAQPSEPETVIRGTIDALNAGDVDAALTLVAADAVVTLFPPPETQGVYVGKDAIRGWWKQFTARHGQVEFVDFHVWGDTASWTARVSEDAFAELGLAAVDFTGVGIVQGGLLKTAAWSMTETALTRFQTAVARATNQSVARRFIEDLFNQGQLAVADEILAPNFVDHTPRPGMGTDRTALKQDIASFHQQFPEGLAQFRIDDLIATEDQVVVRGVLLVPDQEGAPAKVEGPGYIVILGLKNGQITERWATFMGWGE